MSVETSFLLPARALSRTLLESFATQADFLLMQEVSPDSPFLPCPLLLPSLESAEFLKSLIELHKELFIPLVQRVKKKSVLFLVLFVEVSVLPGTYPSA